MNDGGPVRETTYNSTEMMILNHLQLLHYDWSDHKCPYVKKAKNRQSRLMSKVGSGFDGSGGTSELVERRIKESTIAELEVCTRKSQDNASFKR